MNEKQQTTVPQPQTAEAVQIKREERPQPTHERFPVRAGFEDMRPIWVATGHMPRYCEVFHPWASVY